MIVVLDTDNKEIIKLLAAELAPYLNNTVSDEWVDEQVAREILSGNKGKPICRKTLRLYREDKTRGIEYRQLGPRSFLYYRPSLMRFISTR